MTDHLATARTAIEQAMRAYEHTRESGPGWYDADARVYNRMTDCHEALQRHENELLSVAVSVKQTCQRMNKVVDAASTKLAALRTENEQLRAERDRLQRAVEKWREKYMRGHNPTR